MGIKGPNGPPRGVIHIAEAVTRTVVPSMRPNFFTGGRRALEGGTAAVMSDFSNAEEILDGVSAIVRGRLSDITVLHVKGLVRADELPIDDAETFIVNGLQNMFAHAASRGLSQVETLALIAGKDRFGSAKIKITKEERFRRIVEAQLAAIAEMIQHGIDSDYTGLYARHMLPLMIEYTRKFVNRAGKEHGLRFELRMSHLIELFPYLTAIRPMHQALAPTIAGTGRVASFDCVLFGLLEALAAQYKAYGLLDALANGTVKLVKSGGIVTGVSGPDLPAQIVSDGLRAIHDNFRVLDGQLAPQTHNLSRSTLSIIDTSHIIDPVIDLFDDAWGSGIRQVNPLVDFNIAPRRAEFLRNVFGTSVPRTHEVDLRDTLERYITDGLAAKRDAMNAQFQTQEIVDALGGRVLEVGLFADHQIDEIHDFGAAKQVFQPRVVDEGL